MVEVKQNVTLHQPATYQIRCRHHAAEGIKLYESYANDRAVSLGHLLMAKVQTEKGDFSGTVKSIQKAERAAAHGIAPDYARRLLAAFSMPEPEPTDPSISQTQEPDLIEPLSKRELKVLQLMAEGLTNPEIASRLFVSPKTVKAHARNIYGKLGVRNRTQAVTRARALGILPSIKSRSNQRHRNLAGRRIAARFSFTPEPSPSCSRPAINPLNSPFG